MTSFERWLTPLICCFSFASVPVQDGISIRSFTSVPQFSSVQDGISMRSLTFVPQFSSVQFKMGYLCARSSPFHSSVQFSSRWDIYALVHLRSNSSVQFSSRWDIYALVHLRSTVQFSVAVETVVPNVGLTDDGPFYSSFGHSVAVETVVNNVGLIKDGPFHSSLTTVLPLKLLQRWGVFNMLTSTRTPRLH